MAGGKPASGRRCACAADRVILAPKAASPALGADRHMPARRLAALALAPLALAGTARADAPAPAAAPPPPPSVTVVLAGRLVDPVSGRELVDQAVVIRGDRVALVGPRASTATPPGARVIDLSHRTVLPGLIDVHVHLTADADQQGPQALTVSLPRQAINGVANARRTLEAGFTTVRNVGADGFTDVALRDAIADGVVEGPRMQVSGPPLGAVGGHADDNLLPFEYGRQAEGIATGPWALRGKVREDVKYGADLIKVMVSGGVLSHGDSVGGQQLSQEEMNAIVEEAHMWGKRVAVHAHGAEAIKTAIRAGVDSVEHASLIDDAGIAMAKAHGAYLDMDIYDDDFILSEGARVGIEPASLDKERQVGRLQRENFRKAWRAGVKMAFATDAGVYPHGDNARQFAKMVEWGMTPMQAIQAATVSAADLMNLTGKVGRLAPGAYADLIAVDADPLTDVRTLEHVTFVMKGGQVVKGG